ncbi:MAG: hypothetical protein KTR23_01755 [Rhodospirillales bacterium]|nr:hypothetical protein [Rhodospirillales bacterium]
MKNLLIAFLAFFSGEGQATNVLYQQNYETALSVSAEHELVLRGENRGAEAATLVVRLDDAHSVNYASRVNEEWVVLPGKFELHLPVAAFHTPKKRKLDLVRLKSLTVFTAEPDVALAAPVWNKAERFDANVLALDFGPSGSAVFPGFTPLSDGDPRISGKLEAIERPYLDSLIADGVRGIERISLPAKPGQYQLTIWTEDIGQWETPPRYIERRIKINGATVLQERFSDQDWLRQRYLQNAQTVGLPERGRPLTFSVSVGAKEQGIDIAFAGNNKTALFVSALILEKGLEPRMRDQVAAIREKRFAALWPIVDMLRHNVSTLQADITPSGLGEIEVSLTPDQDEVIDSVVLDLPPSLSGEVRFAQVRLGRPDPQKRVLYRDDRTLRGDVIGRSLKKGVSQRFHVLIFARPGLASGAYSGQLKINQHVFDVKVAVKEPREKAVRDGLGYRGVYLDHAYYLTNPSERRSQLWCDATFLAKLGFKTVAPPFSLEVPEFKQDYAFYQAAGFEGPIFVYAALKRWIKKYGVEEAASRLRQVNQPNLIWSIADEPSNPSSNPGRLAEHIKLLRNLVPGVRLAGHLNSKRDVEFIDLFDVVLVNAGFIDELDEVPSETELWFYNIQRSDGSLPSFAYETKNARGFLQWHARNPVGDPYDPTDGREGDKSFLQPSANMCDAVPDIDSHLLNLIEFEGKS